MDTEARYRDAIRGCFIGGTAGDALGYPAKFFSEDEIYSRYGKQGITHYNLDFDTGKALISSETQMFLYAATGILLGFTRGELRGVMGSLESYIYFAGKNWAIEQTGNHLDHAYSWLAENEETYVSRTPNSACVDALISDKMGTISEPHNNSKNCCGIMCAMPVACYFGHDCYDERAVVHAAANAMAITHGHPLSWLSAAMLADVLYSAVAENLTNIDLKDAISRSEGILKSEYEDVPYLDEFLHVMDFAVGLASDNGSDQMNINRIGKGKTASKALGIALFCALRHEHDFSGAIIAASNCGGDSSVVGAIAGSIVGAVVGYSAISEQRKTDLELNNVILEIADDIYRGPQMRDEDLIESDEAWIKKYAR